MSSKDQICNLFKELGFRLSITNVPLSNNMDAKYVFKMTLVGGEEHGDDLYYSVIFGDVYAKMEYGGVSANDKLYDYKTFDIMIRMDDNMKSLINHLSTRTFLLPKLREYKFKELGI